MHPQHPHGEKLGEKADRNQMLAELRELEAQ